MLLAAVVAGLTPAFLECATAAAGPVTSLRFAIVSSNWAGYAVTGSSRSPVRYKSVSAHWVQPSVACTGGQSYSGFWVGLGGFEQSSRALEQIGTEADCSSSGSETDYAWYELVPKAPVRLSLKLHPGEEIIASVTVTGHGVTLRLRDLTTGAHYQTTQRAAVLDASSAEWIAEAPSLCHAINRCRVLPLANFGSVAFSDSSATPSNGDAMPINASLWSPTALELLDPGTGPGGPRFGGPAAIATAEPTSLDATGSAFTVAWQQAPASSTAPGPTGPLGGNQA
jgi:hypothetical protein